MGEARTVDSYDLRKRMWRVNPGGEIRLGKPGQLHGGVVARVLHGAPLSRAKNL
jgi:hypothetical protein